MINYFQRFAFLLELVSKGAEGEIGREVPIKTNVEIKKLFYPPFFAVTYGKCKKETKSPIIHTVRIIRLVCPLKQRCKGYNKYVYNLTLTIIGAVRMGRGDGTDVSIYFRVFY